MCLVRHNDLNMLGKSIHEVSHVSAQKNLLKASCVFFWHHKKLRELDIKRIKHKNIEGYYRHWMYIENRERISLDPSFELTLQQLIYINQHVRCLIW